MTDPPRDRDPLEEARRLKRAELLAKMVTAVVVVAVVVLLAVGVAAT